MRMIWFKAWREAKPRLEMALIIVLLVGVSNVLAVHFFPPQSSPRIAFRDNILGTFLPPASGDPHSEAQIAWSMYLQLAVVLIPLLGVMMASSGIYSRLAYGLKEETHPSMIYTLALPVPRRRWLEMRAGLGLALTAGLALVMLAIPAIFAPFLGQAFSWGWPLRTAPFLLAGTAVFYMFAVLLEVLGNENWRLGSVAAFLFLIAAQLGFGNRLRLFTFFAGYDASVTWMAACLVLSVVFYAGALAAFERCEF
jgi:hypothetical protein